MNFYQILLSETIKSEFLCFAILGFSCNKMLYMVYLKQNFAIYSKIEDEEG